MIYHIIRKEILHNLLSLRFILSLLLSIILFAASGFVFASKFRQQSDDYWNQTNKNLSALSEESNQLYKLAFYKQHIYRKPKPLSLCAEGFEKSFPNRFEFDVFWWIYPEVKNRNSIMVSRFSNIDWVFITSLILSFVALVFTYDSICGERETGMLRLMLATSVPRYKVLFGKYIGVMFTLGIPLFVGILVNLIIVTSHKNIVFNSGEWLKILVIILLSLLYLSIFVLLGMFVSSRMTYSANSMVILLLVWVGLVILTPSFGRIVANAFGKLPTRTELEQMRITGAEELQSKASSGKFGDIGSRIADLKHPAVKPPGHAAYINATTDAPNRLMESYINQMMAQVYIGRRFISFSPTMIYQRASEVIAGTGINRCMNLYQQIKRYQADLKEYLYSKDAEDTDTLHLLFPHKWLLEKWEAFSKKPVDFATVPKFQEKDLALGQSLQLVIWDIGLLVMFNLVFFTAAFVSFLRYDVR